MGGFKFGGKYLTKGRYDQGDYEGFLVTPSDTVDLPNGPCQAICVLGNAGNVAAQNDIAADATSVITIGAAAVGEVYPVMLSRILATGTTATAVYALYKKGN